MIDDTVLPENNVAPEEKLVPQSQVNKIVGRAKEDAYSSGIKDGMSQSNAVSEERIRQIADEAAKTNAQNLNDQYSKKMQEEQARHLVDRFQNDLIAGKEKYPDILKDVEGLQLQTMPTLVKHALDSGHTAEFMHELANNPQKALAIHQAEMLGNPVLAARLTRDLAASINNNLVAAKTMGTPKEPLSQIKPSPEASGDDGMSIADLRKQKHLRV